MTDSNVVNDWRTRAGENLRAAIQLLEGETHPALVGPAASRGYYALFQGCVAALLREAGTRAEMASILKGRDDVHLRTRDHLENLSVASREDLKKLFERARGKRVDADYHPSRYLHERDIRKLVDDIEAKLRFLGVV